MIMLVNQFLDMVHLSMWIDYLGNGEMLTFFFRRTEHFPGPLTSAHETWDQPFTCCVFLFSIVYYKYSRIQSSRYLLTRTYITVYLLHCTYKNGQTFFCLLPFSIVTNLYWLKVWLKKKKNVYFLQTMFSTSKRDNDKFMVQQDIIVIKRAEI
jgi:hypothetical protein